MLCGEYDVLFKGGGSLAFAIDSYLQLLVILGEHTSQTLAVVNMQSDSDTAVSKMLATVAEELLAPLEVVAEVKLWSQLHPSYGFGSSSALLLALNAARVSIDTERKLKEKERWQIAKASFQQQLRYQGHASGYDTLTQFLGGIVRYRHTEEWGKNARSLKNYLDVTKYLHIYVGGKGAETRSTVANTLTWLQKESNFPTLRLISEQLMQAFLHTCKNNTLETLITACAHWRSFFQHAPCFPARIEKVLSNIEGCDKNWSYKTSGAGGEDALLIIGWRRHLQQVDAALGQLGWSRHPYSVDVGGMTAEWQP